MEEKILKKSERYDIGKGIKITLAVTVLIYILWGILEELGMDLTPLCERDVWRFGFWGLVGLSVFFLLIYAWLHSYEITITDKRIYGKTAFGRRVDLPADSVSAIGTKWPKGIAVSTSSGKISFLVIKNVDQLHKCLTDMLIERQHKEATPIAPKIETQDTADELRKFKDLLDGGVITQEEFDAKKKQLLGL